MSVCIVDGYWTEPNITCDRKQTIFLQKLHYLKFPPSGYMSATPQIPKHDSKTDEFHS